MRLRVVTEKEILLPESMWAVVGTITGVLGLFRFRIDAGVFAKTCTAYHKQEDLNEVLEVVPVSMQSL